MDINGKKHTVAVALPDVTDAARKKLLDTDERLEFEAWCVGHGLWWADCGEHHWSSTCAICKTWTATLPGCGWDGARLLFGGDGRSRIVERCSSRRPQPA